jgi:RNA polymerase sigma factor (TIGR02999 family)
MRCVLIDHARARRARPAAKLEPSALDMVLVSYENRVLDLLALDEALKKLAKFDARMAQAVELRFFAGLPMDEVARVLEIPKRTLEREWAATRVWLFEEMS